MRRSSWIVSTVLFALTVGLIVGCGGDDAPKGDDAPPATDKQKEKEKMGSNSGR